VRAYQTGVLRARPEASGALRTGLAQLSPRQSEVLWLLADGLSTKAIAARLGLDVKTVESHLKALLGKLGARDRTQLVAMLYDTDAIRERPPRPRPQSAVAGLVGRLGEGDRRVGDLLVRGLGTGGIAARLGVGEDEVQAQVDRVLGVFGARDGVHLAAICYDRGLRRARGKTPPVLLVALAQLSRRELQVLVLLAAGLPDEDIAARLAVTAAVVGDDVTRMLGVLGAVGARSRHHLVAMAYDSGLVVPRFGAMAPAPRPVTPRRSVGNCGVGVGVWLSGWHGRDLQVRVQPSRAGVAARAVFVAAGSAATVQTYDQVAARLQVMGSGASAIVVSSWSLGAARSGGHAYAAVNVQGRIYLYDPSTKTLSGWPPYWEQDAVALTAVGYLKPDGEPAEPLVDAQAQLDPADRVGLVQGGSGGALTGAKRDVLAVMYV